MQQRPCLRPHSFFWFRVAGKELVNIPASNADTLRSCRGHSPMKRTLILLAIFCTSPGICHAQPGNLLASGDFESLKPWQANDHLQKHGRVTLMPKEQGVLIHNPVIDLDASLYQDIATEGQAAFAWSARIKGGGMMRASLAFVSLDAHGETLAIETPTKVQGTSWKTFQGTVHVPPATKTLRVVLAVLDGSCSFAKLELRQSNETGRAAWQGRSGSKRAASPSGRRQQNLPKRVSPSARCRSSVRSGSCSAMTSMATANRRSSAATWMASSRCGARVLPLL